MATEATTIYSLPSEVLAKVLTSGLSIEDVRRLAKADLRLVVPAVSAAVRSQIWKETLDVPARLISAAETCQWCARVYADLDKLESLNVLAKSERSAFKLALGELIEGAMSKEAEGSKNLMIIEHCVRNPRNADVLFPSDWPIARFLTSCLHVLFSLRDTPPNNKWCDLPNFKYQAFTTDVEIFDFANLELGNDRTVIPVVALTGLRQFLSIIQLFRYHLLYAEHDGPAFFNYRNLTLSQLPRGWTRPVKTRKVDRPRNSSLLPELHERWKGLSSSMSVNGVCYLHTLHDWGDFAGEWEQWGSCAEVVEDDESSDGFESMSLWSPSKAVRWFPQFTEFFSAPTSMDRWPIYGVLRAQGVMYALSGGLQPVDDVALGPTAVSAADFQRLFFIAIPFDERRQGFVDLSLLDMVNNAQWAQSLDASCFAFEGLMVPGGNMVAGQWKSMVSGWRDLSRGDRISTVGVGPFIFWTETCSKSSNEDETVKEWRPL